MMETYTLIDIIMMLRDQRFRKYQGINVMLEIFDDDSISPTRKKHIMVAALRACGLFEIGFEGDRNAGDIFDSPDENKQDFKGIKVPMQLFRCHLLNAIIQFDSLLN